MKRIQSLLETFGLPTKINKDMDINEIFQFMEVDKKTLKQKPRFVVLKKIGKIKTEHNTFSFEIDKDIIKKAIETSK